ncbi:hypothetical protein [Halorubrum sp. ARQ200]|uniref:hypothetical protein n=1 Tax=Halorubrum sp. ARQ200 TaxID=1855872 RepID=UPI0010F5FE81|nr:hypothetical protein [Halorubrum sp. ARQ200]TKX46069.1 hypothetical protein EXE50_02400 [Halorubrum sp. ARQ200]
MTNPDEIISSIFALAVAAVMLLALFQVYTGGSVARVSEIAGTLALPFVLLLLGLYAVLMIKQNV